MLTSDSKDERSRTNIISIVIQTSYRNRYAYIGTDLHNNIMLSDQDFYFKLGSRLRVNR